jgi:hypothetical protein
MEEHKKRLKGTPVKIIINEVLKPIMILESFNRLL